MATKRRQQANAGENGRSKQSLQGSSKHKTFRKRDKENGHTSHGSYRRSSEGSVAYLILVGAVGELSNSARLLQFTAGSAVNLCNELEAHHFNEYTFPKLVNMLLIAHSLYFQPCCVLSCTGKSLICFLSLIPYAAAATSARSTSCSSAMMEVLQFC